MPKASCWGCRSRWLNRRGERVASQVGDRVECLPSRIVNDRAMVVGGASLYNLRHRRTAYRLVRH